MEQSKAPKNQDNTAENTNKGEDGCTLANSSSRVGEGPPPPPENSSPKENSDPSWQKKLPLWTFIGEIFLLLVTGYIACIYSGQLDAMRDSIRLSQRPWMGLEDTANAIVATPIRFDGDGNATMDVRVIAKNYSSNAAQNVWVYGDLLVVNNLAPVLERENWLCSRESSKDVGKVIFPGSTRSVDQWPTSVPREKIPSAKYLNAFFVGCVHYQDQFGHLYHTSFRYRLNKPEDTPHAVRFQPTPNTEVSGVFVANGGSID
jgi:hypothetical protein